MPTFFRLRRTARSACLLAAAAAAPLAAQAALQARDANGDTTPDAYYDTTLDIT